MADVSKRPAPRREPAPSVVVWASGLVLVVTTTMLLWGAWHTGISTDEPFHVFRLRNLFATGWYLLDDDLAGSSPGPWVTDEYVYAPVAALLMHAVCVLLGIEGGGDVATSSAAYGVRHLVVAVIGLLGTLAVAGIGRLVLRSWSWGVVAAATLMTVPMWPGLSMFDLKDVPAATGYTLVTLGLALCLRSSRSGAATATVTIGTLVAGILLAVGARPGLWPGLALGAAVVVVCSVVRDHEGRLGWVRWRLVELAVAGAVAYALLWLAYPAMFSRPDRWLLSSVLASSDYSGQALGTWSYIPSKVSGLMPPLLLLLGCVGCLAAFFEWRGRRWTLHEARVVLVVSQALVLPVLAILREAHLYDDLRQVVFALPAVAVLLTMGLKHFTDDLSASGKQARRVALSLWVVALLAPTVVQVQLFPYNYAYASPQADLIGAPVEPDFWRTSFRELLPDVPVDEFVVCSPLTTDEGVTMRYVTITGRPSAEAGTNCLTDPISPLTPYLDRAPEASPEVGETFVALFERGRLPGSNCETLAEVTRSPYLTPRVMSRVARCDLVLNPYPGSAVSFGSDGTGSEFLLGGWTSHPDEPGVRLREPHGSLGFELPTGWDETSLRVELTGAAAGTPEVWVNNEPVPVTQRGDGWSLDVPAEVVAAMGQGRLVVTLAQPQGQPLVLSGLRLEQL